VWSIVITSMKAHFGRKLKGITPTAGGKNEHQAMLLGADHQIGRFTGAAALRWCPSTA
jgi:hypothetical protein